MLTGISDDVIQDKPAIKKILRSIDNAAKPTSLSATGEPPSRDDYNEVGPVDDVGRQSSPEYAFNQYVSW
jgi:hypothetical protein